MKAKRLRVRRFMTVRYTMAAPLFVIHGANDPRVPLSEAEQLVSALRARGVPVEFLVFDDEGHGLAKLKNKLMAYPATVEFLDRHV
jgi:dipeptidyl aminopeptidase/acylaminoacyl peptidase